MLFSDIKVGQTAEITHNVTSSDIEAFVHLSGDDNKLHVDEVFAAKTNFKKPVVHGMLGASFISTIIGTKLPGDGALWFSQTLDFLLPVRVNDTIKVCAEVIKKHERDNSIELRTDIYNQFKQKVTSGIAKVKILEVVEEVSDHALKAETRKVALVVGASGGIGYATSIKLASEGWDLLLHYHTNKQKINDLENEIKRLGRQCHVVQANLLDVEEIKNIQEGIKRHYNHLTAMVNCTTIKIPNIKFSSLSWEDVQDSLDINIKANFFLLKALVPFFELNVYGKVVCMTTQYTESTPPTELIQYVTAKSALNGFIKAMAVELAPKGIRVNLVSPGMTQTDLISDIPEKVKLLTSAKTPLKRLAKPIDIANAISYLVSDKSDFLTGETIRINGGQVMI